jgi:hypothetical protein
VSAFDLLLPRPVSAIPAEGTFVLDRIGRSSLSRDAGRWLGGALGLRVADDEPIRFQVDRGRHVAIGVHGRRSAGRKLDGRPHGGYYTTADLREIVAYAAARAITVVPEIDVPGHTQAAIAAYPELGNLATPVPVWTS